MTPDPDRGGWRTTTDRSMIREWADNRDAVPVQREGPDGEPTINVEPDARRVGDDQITWEQFFERFEAGEYVFRYRGNPAGEGPNGRCEVVEGGRDDSPPETGAEPDRIAASDSGDDEPPVPEGSGETDPTGTDPDPAVDETTMSESARGAERPALVLDEIYEAPRLAGSAVDDEYVVFRNDGDDALDVSGWRVENDAGRSYVFPDGFELAPGERVTLHSGRGDDTGADLYWDATDPVWDERGGTVTVTTRDGRRVLREPFKG